jgi:serine/threonine protein kinase/tetratricopeptide (TPR) repeat protein
MVPMSPVTGTTLGRYRLIAPLGAGGMGEVWRAHDVNLDREVAVKLLAHGALSDSATRERFRREAHVLASLSHPGVATIYDFDVQDGVDFIVMELVHGGSLESRLESGPLPIDDVTRVGAAIADALHDAHARGFLHRDLKPGNVVLTRDGQPKILDFGLALLLAGGKASGKLTQTGTIVGSLPYMSPEQLLGDADSVSTDVYALGVLLFEMTTGRRPFVKERAEALMFEIFGNAAPSMRSIRPDVPPELDRLVGDCLAKEPAQRPATAAAVAEALRSVASGTRTQATFAAPDNIRAIAVLPLRNVSRDPTQEYFADGMTEAIISDLARIRALRVISYTSVIRYKGADKSIPEIARELNVEAILEGSALLVGNRVRVSVQLVSARADQTLWADRYDRELTDVLALQSELAESVAREIAIQLTPDEARRLTTRAAVNPEAHLEVMKCKHSALAGSRDALDVAVRHARRALELDPSHAPAWAALADCQTLRAVRGMAAPAEAGAEATAAARRALELDPTLADAHVALGLILSHSGAVREGLRELDRGIELNPGLALAHNMRSRGLYAFERHEEALAEANLSVQIDPLSTFIRTAVGDAYYFAREYEKSVFHYRMAIELDPRFDGAHTDLARTLEALGRFDEGRAAYEEGRRLSGGVAGPTFGLAHLEIAAGDEPAARAILDELTAARGTRVVSAWGIAAVHACLGEVDESYRWLDVAVTEKASGLILLRVHPRLDPIRGDPRYWPLVRKVGLADE